MIIAKKFLDLLSGILSHFGNAIPSNTYGTILHGLSNIIGGKLKFRDIVLKHPCCLKCIEIYQAGKFSLEIDNSITWFCSNMCGGPPFPSFEEASALTSICCQNLIKYEVGVHEDLELEAVWCISLYVESNDKKDLRIENMVTSNTVKRMLQLTIRASHGADYVLIKPLIRFFGNMFVGSNEIIESILNLELVQVNDR